MEISDQPNPLPNWRKNYEDLLTDIVVALVAHPNDVEVFQVKDNGCLHFEITANKEDRGQVIGRKGSTIGALHRILTAIARGYSVKIDLKEDVGE